MFVTIEPSHTFDWTKYNSWEAYNERFTDLFLNRWSGGPILEELLEPIDGMEMHDVWMTDAIKCPPPDGVDNLRREQEFEHCRTYLTDEIEAVNPKAIVTLVLEAVTGEGRSIKSSRECGRIIDGPRPIILSTHWGNSWLHRSPTSRWGEDWKGEQEYLQADSYATYMDVVRAAIQSVISDSPDGNRTQ